MKIRWPFKKISHKHWIGINLSQMCPSAVIYRAGEVVKCISFTAEEGPQALTQWLKANAPEGIPTVLILDDSDYELLLVEAPAVPDEELSVALEFRIADLLALPVAETSIQAVRLPSDAYRGRMSMAHVIAAPNTVIAQHVEWANKLGLALKLITVPEFCLLNLLALLDVEQGIALLDLGATQGRIRIYQAGALYLTRQVEVGLDALDIEVDALEQATASDELFIEQIDEPESAQESEQESEQNNEQELELLEQEVELDVSAIENQPELDVSEYVSFAPKAKVNEQQLQNLILEVQRSLDYYESQLGMGQITRLWLIASGFDLTHLVDAMGSSLTAQIEQPDFTEILIQLGIKLEACNGPFNKMAIAMGGALAYAEN